MRRVVKWVLLLWPLGVWAAAFWWNAGEKKKLEGRVADPGIVWGSGEKQAKVSVGESVEGEATTHRILVQTGDGRVLCEESFTVNRDVSGGGFVKAMQVDGDEELEIVAWGRAGTEKSFFLDFSTGEVLRQSFSDASPEAQNLAREWLQAHVLTPRWILLLGIVAVGYYFLLGFGWLGMWLVRQSRF